MIPAVVAGAQQLGHAAVRDHEGLAPGSLHVQYAHDERPGFAHDEAARLQNQPEPAPGHGRQDRRGDAREIDLGVVPVGDTESTTHVDVLERDALIGKRSLQGEDLARGSLVRFGVHDLGPDVDRDSRDLERGPGGRPSVEVHDFVGGNAELGAGVPRSRVLVWRRRGDVQVHTQRDAGLNTPPDGDSFEQVQLLAALDVEAVDSGLEPGAQLPLALARAGEDDPLRGNPRLEGARQLSSAHDVGAGTETGQAVEERQVSVGLDRIRHEQAGTPESGFEGAIPVFQQGPVVEVKGGPEASGDVVEGERSAAEHAVRASQRSHLSMPAPTPPPFQQLRRRCTAMADWATRTPRRG